jgi:CO/xanthine dehydrogenase Mo-binding subunit
MLSTAKSEAVARDLKSALEKRGFSVEESVLTDAVDGKDGRRLSIDNDKMSIQISAKDAVSKDVFGNDLKAFTPHVCELAIDSDSGATHVEVAKVMMDLGKIGFALKIGEGTDIAAAEAAAALADEERHNSQWPTKGA